MNYRLVTGPSTEPLTYAEAKAYLRLNDDSEQSLVTSLISAARGIVEGQTWRPLISQVWATQLDFSEVNTSVIRINKAPIISIDTITYYDSNNALQTLSASNWESDIYGSPARVRLKTPPIVYERMNALQVNFTAGYANAAAVPNDIKSALYMIIGHLYENRQDVVTGTQVNEIPMASKYLLEPYRNSLLSAYQN
tara:strand:- start:124 stop:708 length:585 start_codon:yes stop_codon:yes gene_type:complete